MGFRYMSAAITLVVLLISITSFSLSGGNLASFPKGGCACILCALSRCFLYHIHIPAFLVSFTSGLSDDANGLFSASYTTCLLRKMEASIHHFLCIMRSVGGTILVDVRGNIKMIMFVHIHVRNVAVRFDDVVIIRCHSRQYSVVRYMLGEQLHINTTGFRVLCARTTDT
jgi:hypothetical protein